MKNLPSGIKKRYVNWCRLNLAPENEETLDVYLREVELKINEVIHLGSEAEADYLLEKAEEYYQTGSVDYPIYSNTTFDDNGYRYTIKSFFWTGGDRNEVRPFYAAFKKKLPPPNYRKELELKKKQK